MFTKETWRRTYRTFIQAFTGVIASNIAMVLGAVDISRSDWWKMLLVDLVVPAVASGVAAAMNLESQEMN